ncbi:MAG: hypothetical protein IT357_13010 [Gemmatimonadaceae bacterium]|nr:hypothetical protein [Gemmatimonadaceae bacterium]
MATPRHSRFARWLRRSQRGIAALLLGLLALGCAEPLSELACCGGPQLASAAHAGPIGTLVVRGVEMRDIGQGAPAGDRHDDANAPGSREQPAAPHGVSPPPCACVNAVPVSALSDLASTAVVDSSSAPCGGDSTLPPSPVLELHLRPPLAHLG